MAVKIGQIYHPFGYNDTGWLPPNYNSGGDGGGSIYQPPQILDDPPNVYDANDMATPTGNGLCAKFVNGVVTYIPCGEIVPLKLDTVLATSIPPNFNTVLPNPVVNPILSLWSKVETFGKANPILAAVIVGGIGYALFSGKKGK